jgi:hypothetical protein
LEEISGTGDMRQEKQAGASPPAFFFREIGLNYACNYLFGL